MGEKKGAEEKLREGATESLRGAGRRKMVRKVENKH